MPAFQLARPVAMSSAAASARRLLDEPIHARTSARPATAGRRPRQDVAVPGLGAIRRHAQRHQRSRRAATSAAAASAARKPRLVGDVSVRRQDEHDLVGRPVDRLGGQGDGRGGVAAHRLAEEVATGDLGQLLARRAPT